MSVPIIRVWCHIGSPLACDLVCRWGSLEPCMSLQTMTTETKMVPEMSVSSNQLTRLIAKEDTFLLRWYHHYQFKETETLGKTYLQKLPLPVTNNITFCAYLLALAYMHPTDYIPRMNCNYPVWESILEIILYIGTILAHTMTLILHNLLQEHSLYEIPLIFAGMVTSKPYFFLKKGR
jgi:hypothetical protein